MPQTQEPGTTPCQLPKLSRVRTEHAPAPGCALQSGDICGDLVYISGQRPSDPATGVIPRTFAEQANMVLGNLMRLLSAAGSSPAFTVKVNVYLSDLSYFDEFNTIYQQYFAPPYPARTTVGVMLRGILIELDALALASRYHGPDDGTSARARARPWGNNSQLEPAWRAGENPNCAR